MSLLLTRALADGPLALSDIPQHPAGPQAGVTAGCPDRTGLSALLTAEPPAHPEPGDTAFREGVRSQFDAAAIRARCTADPEFGAELRQRLLQVLARRLRGTRTRLIAGSMSGGA